MKFYLVNTKEYLRQGVTKTYQYDKYNLSQLIRKNINQLKLSCQIENGTEYILSVQYSGLPKSETIKLMDSSNKLQWAEIDIEINKEYLKVSIIKLAQTVVGQGLDNIIQLSFEIDDTSFLNDLTKVAEYTKLTGFNVELSMTNEMLTRLPGGVFHFFINESHGYFLYDGKTEEYTIGNYVFNFSTKTIQFISLFLNSSFIVYYDETNIPQVTLNSLTLNYNGEAKLSYTQSSSFINDIHYSYQLFSLKGEAKEVASTTIDKLVYDFSKIFNFVDNTKYQAQVSFTYQYKDYANNIYDYTVTTKSNELTYYVPPTVTLKATLNFNGEISINYQVTGPTVNTITKGKCSYVIYRVICDNKIEKYSGSAAVQNAGENFIIKPSNIVLERGEYYQVKVTLQYYWSSNVGSVEDSQTTLSDEKLWAADNSFNTLMQNIAIAIREKTGHENHMTIKNMIEVLNNYDSQTGYYDDSKYDDTSVDSCLKKLAKVIRIKLIGSSLELPLTLVEMPKAISAIRPSGHQGCDACESYSMSYCEGCEGNEGCLSCEGSCDGCQDCQTTCEATCQGCEGCDSCNVCQGCQVGDSCSDYCESNYQECSYCDSGQDCGTSMCSQGGSDCGCEGGESCYEGCYEQCGSCLSND